MQTHSIYEITPASGAATENGQGGRSLINARSVNLASDSVVTTSATDAGGIAGNIEISSNQLQLSDRSGIIATTLSGNGGNIILNPKNLLLLRNNSNISTTAGLARAGGDGGNININGGFVVAVPRENSDITANAFLGRGGNINITTNGIYGINFQNQLTPRSDITASSQFGINGTVNLDISDIDPARGLTQLPETFLEASDQIRAGCPADRDARFVVTGRGGLPEDPRTTLRGTVVMQDFRATALSSVAEQTRTTPIHITRNSQLPITHYQLPIVEAQGWIINKQGQIELVANLPQKSRSSLNNEINCSKNY